MPRWEDLANRGLATPAWRVRVPTEAPPFPLVPEPSPGDIVVTPSGIRWTFLDGVNGNSGWSLLSGPPGPAGPAGPAGTPILHSIILWRDVLPVPAGWHICDGAAGTHDAKNAAPKDLKYIEYIG